MAKRAAGILLPIASLSSDYGIGCFSKEAYEFADFLAETGQEYWQILPLNPTGFGNSPYQSFSGYAGNPYFIDLKAFLKDDSLIKPTHGNYTDYEYLYKTRFKILKKIYAEYKPDEEYKKFIKENSTWLEDYAVFSAAKEYFGGAEWIYWDDDIKFRTDLNKYKKLLHDDIEFFKFLQYIFYSQWKKLKAYVNSKGIKIIGDMPIYVSFDSSDVWSAPQYFELDENLFPKSVAGCPPDGFSHEGQLWGNPLYNWEEHKKDGYNWWIKRTEHAFSMFDILRIDHFRGFDEYYSVPYGAKNAKNGTWKTAPGHELFSALQKTLGKRKFIAEDLGFITDSVKKLLTDCGFPGMRVLQFAFDKRDTGNTNDYLPHNYIKNCVAYTGTHDNNTISAWFAELTKKEKENVRKYLCDYYTPDEKINLPLIGLAMRSCAELCIIPLQDYMGLGGEARINTPSTVGNNWEWRLKKGEPNKHTAKIIRDMTMYSGRISL